MLTETQMLESLPESMRRQAARQLSRTENGGTAMCDACRSGEHKCQGPDWCRCICQTDNILQSVIARYRRLKSAAEMTGDRTELDMFVVEVRTGAIWRGDSSAYESPEFRGVIFNQSLHGSSQFKGVSWNKIKRKWLAAVQIKGQRMHLGYFEHEKDAGDAVVEARRTT